MGGRARARSPPPPPPSNNPARGPARAPPPPLHGPHADRPGRQRKTPRRQRTVVAAGCGRRALQRPEIHDRLIVTSGSARVELRGGQFGEEPAAGRRVDRLGDVEQAGEHAVDIAVHRSHGFVVCRRADRRRSILPHSPQRPHVGIRTREHSAELRDDLPCGRMQIAGTAVITEPLPELHHLVLPGGGERPHVGETLRETQVIVPALRDAGLLENHLRKPDEVGIARAAPRQVAPAAGVPIEQYGCDVGHFGGKFNHSVPIFAVSELSLKDKTDETLKTLRPCRNTS